MHNEDEKGKLIVSLHMETCSEHHHQAKEKMAKGFQPYLTKRLIL
jgi:hypothetical protein